MAERKEYPHDDKFPDNVNPTDENRRKFSQDMDKRQKEQEKEAAKVEKTEKRAK